MRSLRSFLIFLYIFKSAACFGAADFSNVTIRVSTTSEPKALHCENLYQSSCSGNYEQDGTLENLSRDRIYDHYDSLVKTAENKIKNLLKNPKNNMILPYLIEKMDLICEGEKCIEEVVHNLSLTLRIEMLDAESISKRLDNITEEDFFLRQGVLGKNREFQIIRKWFLEEHKKIYDTSARQRLIQYSIFPKVKELMIAKITRLNIDESTRSKMLEKINTIKYKPGCAESNSVLSDLFYDNAEYDPIKHSASVCNGSLNRENSVYEIVHSLAHEIGHAIDPCGLVVDYTNTDKTSTRLVKAIPISIDSEKAYPLKNLISCLREPLSIRAQQRNNEGVEKAGMYCSDDDQIRESVADWFAAEILPAYVHKYMQNTDRKSRIAGYRNAVRAFCGHNYNEFKPHPDGPNRINKLLQVQPVIRQHMGCDREHDKYKYCSETTPIKTNTPKPASRGVASVAVKPESFTPEFALTVRHHTRESTFEIIREDKKLIFIKNIDGTISKKEVSANFLKKLKNEINSWNLKKSNQNPECQNSYISIQTSSIKYADCIGSNQKVERLANSFLIF